MIDSALIKTERLSLVLESTEEIEARINALLPEDRAQVSAAWLDRLRSASTPGPWTHGLSIRLSRSGEEVGSCAFKGPPDETGTVEIAYGIAEEFRRQGYAKEAAIGLVHFAFGLGSVRCVCAHTLPDNIASMKVLEAAGFTFTGEVLDMEDGLVRRYEVQPF